MVALKNKLVVCLSALFLWSGANTLPAQVNSGNHITISGVVKDKQNQRNLGYVNVSVPGTNIGTVTNDDGFFSLKFKDTGESPVIEISHLGYHNYRNAVDRGNLTDMKIWLTPYADLLNEIVILPNDPRLIVEKAIEKIPRNYSIVPNMLTGFYRETAQKGRHYINISEAIVDVYKTSYNESVDHDRVEILKGRRLLSQKPGDTLGVKLLGGPNLFINLDVVKNRNNMLSTDELPYYAFMMEEPVSIDNRPQYVISFRPAANIPDAPYYGRFYIDKERLAFTRAEFSLVMDDVIKATRIMLYKKPAGLRFKPQELSFLITYKYDNGVTYLNYIRNIIRFKCDWKRRLFATNYNVISEMVVTDRRDKDVTPIPDKMAFGNRDAFYDKVTGFENGSFWGNYNIIEPTESLEQVVGKLIKRSR